MANKKFTLEEMEYLRGNKYVLDVTGSCVYFSAAYKAEFYQKLLAGKKAKDIFAESGINTDILGANRVNGFRSLVLREAKSGKGFRDISTYTEFSGNYATSPDVRIKYLEQELAYKNQEITEQKDNLLNVSWLCRVAGVSRAGYDSYLQNEEKRALRET